jgi:hypothetical protein
VSAAESVGLGSQPRPTRDAEGDRLGGADHVDDTPHTMPREPATPNPRQMEAYASAGFRLLTLGRRDKRPVNVLWTKVAEDTDDVLRRVREEGMNAGVLLPGSVVVVDLDPRNAGGKDPRHELERIFPDVDLDKCPHTLTGGGGHHYWFRKPEGMRIRASIDGLDGVDFKSEGGQVVAAGSVHPNGNRYELDDFAPLLSQMPDLPASLAEALRRPPPTPADSEKERITIGYLVKCLDLLDPADFGKGRHDRWFSLMAACHHATDGDGRQEFIDWCMRDPDYAEDARKVGYRWGTAAKLGVPGRVGYFRALFSDRG